MTFDIIDEILNFKNIRDIKYIKWKSLSNI